MRKKVNLTLSTHSNFFSNIKIIFLIGLASHFFCNDLQEVGEKQKLKEKAKMERQTHVLHFYFSNQSDGIAECELRAALEGKEIFHKILKVGTQHTWERIELNVPSGTRKIFVSEKKHSVSRLKQVAVTKELWIMVTFHGPPAKLNIDVFDHPVAVM